MGIYEEMSQFPHQSTHTLCYLSADATVVSLVQRTTVTAVVFKSYKSFSIAITCINTVSTRQLFHDPTEVKLSAIFRDFLEFSLLPFPGIFKHKLKMRIKKQADGDPATVT